MECKAPWHLTLPFASVFQLHAFFTFIYFSIYLLSVSKGPRSITTEDMWRMVWQVESNTIVMLANLFENDKVWLYKWTLLNLTTTIAAQQVNAIMWIQGS